HPPEHGNPRGRDGRLHCLDRRHHRRRRPVEQFDRARLRRIAPQQPHLLQIGQMRVHRRRRSETDRLADVPHRGRIPVARGIALDEVEDLLLALRQILPNVHARRGLLSWSNVCSHKVPTPADGLNPDAEGYTRRRPRADGGIGRRARLRAWSGITGWRFESSSAHVRKPRVRGAFVVNGSVNRQESARAERTTGTLVVSALGVTQMSTNAADNLRPITSLWWLPALFGVVTLGVGVFFVV